MTANLGSAGVKSNPNKVIRLSLNDTEMISISTYLSIFVQSLYNYHSKGDKLRSKLQQL